MSLHLTINTATHLKRNPEQSAQLPDSDKFPVGAQQLLSINWFKRLKDHVLVELSEPREGIYNWYAYAPHVLVVQDGRVLTPAPEVDPPDDDGPRLSPHFTLAEFTVSQTASRRGIINTAPPLVVQRLKLLCTQVLEPARDALGPLRISSGYRSPALNRAVGGSRTSAHMQGYAADVLPLHSSKMAFANWVRDNCKFDQIILEYGTRTNPSWIHVANGPGSRRQYFRIP